MFPPLMFIAHDPQMPAFKQKEKKALKLDDMKTLCTQYEIGVCNCNVIIHNDLQS